MSNPTPVTLASLPRHFRQIALWFVVVLGIGYTTGLVYVWHTTSLTPTGVTERYRGNQPPADAVPSTDTSGAGGSEPLASDLATDDLKFEKSLAEMLNVTHTHMLAMASFLVPITCIFALASRPSSRTKSLLIIEPFVALVVSFGAMWLMRYVHPAFTYLLMASSISFAICLYAMLVLSFRELVGKGGDKRSGVEP